MATIKASLHDQAAALEPVRLAGKRLLGKHRPVQPLLERLDHTADRMRLPCSPASSKVACILLQAPPTTGRAHPVTKFLPTPLFTFQERSGRTNDVVDSD